MKKIKSIGLFLSSFAPLFVLLILKILIEIINQNWSFNFLNCTLLVILISAMTFGIITLFKTVKSLKATKGQRVKVTTKQNLTDQHFLGYFSLFVLFAVSFEIEMYSMAIIFFVVMFMIGVVYIKNDMYYINPLLNIFGYSFYKVVYINSNNQEKQANVFFKGKLILNHNFELVDKYSNLFFIK
ncbi:MAG: hypothetical protein E7378_01235 [Clostridiales bacterium]|nr:hypothetical protein [Clostridiales bacterium]